MKKIYNTIYKKIKKYDTIIIARHIGPDPDALGSQIGLKEIILNSFPKKRVLAVGLPASKFKFLGTLDKINEDDYHNSLLVIVDTPDQKRIDGVDITKVNEKIKIDHHPVLEEFCDLEWIDSSASSASQMIIELCFNTPLKMNLSAAECLFMGVVADTDRFLFDYTSVKTFDLIKKLIEKNNININNLYKNLYMRNLNEVRLQGYIAQNMIVTENGVGYIILTNDIIKEYNVDAASAGNLVNNFNYIENIYVWLTISEDIKQETIRVSIRSRGPIINTLAEQYNGGGHKFASGARVGTIEEAEEIVTKLDEITKIYKENND